jgi:hypothetical protein
MEVTFNEVKTYAVGIAYGISQRGDKYASAFVSDENKPARFSQFSLFLDEDEYDKYGITDAMFDGMENSSRKTAKLETPIPLGNKCLCTAQHAPYGVLRDNGNYRWIHGTGFVMSAGSTQEQAENEAAIQVARRYENADAFADGDEHLKDYRKLVVFELSREELRNLIVTRKVKAVE